jgi:hypothetical protein
VSCRVVSFHGHGNTRVCVWLCVCVVVCGCVCVCVCVSPASPHHAEYRHANCSSPYRYKDCGDVSQPIASHHFSQADQRHCYDFGFVPFVRYPPPPPSTVPRYLKRFAALDSSRTGVYFCRSLLLCVRSSVAFFTFHRLVVLL